MSADRGQIRRSQVITTYGPGALIELPRDSAIVAGLETWAPGGKLRELEEIVEPRLSRQLAGRHGIEWPRFYAPPVDTALPWEKRRGIEAWRFPLWFVVQEKAPAASGRLIRSRRLVHRKTLDEGRRRRFEGLEVVATRFVRACRLGHVDDLDWAEFVHRGEGGCPRTLPLWLDEEGTSGDLAEIIVRCECGKRRRMHRATEEGVLGRCSGALPWLGPGKREDCEEPNRLLIRTATNSYFPRLIPVLSLPEDAVGLAEVVKAHWDDLQIVDDDASLAFIKRKAEVAAALHPFADEQTLEAIRRRKGGGAGKRPVKEAELEAILRAPEGYGDEPPVDERFHVRRLPESHWRRAGSAGGIDAVYQLHRLREVIALTGFTRFDPIFEDFHGEEPEGAKVKVARLADEPKWLPAVENRGEGVFLQFSNDALETWQERPAVRARVAALEAGHREWQAGHDRPTPGFPGARSVLLHTLSHLLIQSFALRCGYPAGAIRERIYVEEEGSGILLYTASPDAEGTLGGLVHQARSLEAHLAAALRSAEVCSNDPVCSEHDPSSSLEGRRLHGAACHGCALISETSCEMRNDHLDRALVAPTLHLRDAAFFDPSAATG